MEFKSELAEMKLSLAAFMAEVKQRFSEAPAEIAFGELTLVDGTIVVFEGEELAAGMLLNVKGEEGIVPAPDGVHETTTGLLVTTKDGVVEMIETKEAEAEVEVEVENQFASLEQFDALRAANEELFGLLGINPESAKEKAFTKGLLGAIAQAAALSGPQARPVGNLQGLGQIGLAGLGGYESAMDKTITDALKGLQIQEMRKKQLQQESGRAALQQAYERMSGLSPQGALAIPGGQAGPTVQRAEMIGQRQPMSQQDILGLAMNPNIDPESAKRILDIAQLSAPKAGPGVVGEYQAAIAGGLIPKDTTLQQYISQVKKPLVQNIIGGQQGLENEMKIRSAFAGEPVYKARQEMQSAYGQITDSLRESSPAGDLAAATKFMKLL